MKKLALIATIFMVMALVSVLASPTSVMAAPDRILEPSFETVNFWAYTEDDGDYNGAQSGAWAQKQGANSYLLSCTNAGIGKKYAQIAQSSVNFTLLDRIFFDTQLYSNQTSFEAQVWVGTTMVWSKAIPTATTDYLKESVDVSTYTGSLDLIIRVENTVTIASGASMTAYFDNIKIWGSHSDTAWTVVCNTFTGSTNHAYMYGENFDAGDTSVCYYDGIGDWKQTDIETAWVGGILNWSSCLFTTWAGPPPTAEAGDWHAVVIKRATGLPSTYDAALLDADYVTDDVFYVASSAIPEFPTIFAAIGVAGLCFGIYYWMKRRLVYVKA